jgi:uncharacterized repeat protein (TIGR03943 family)
MSSSDVGRPRAVLGLAAIAAVSLCTIWLAAAGHLDLYINPRYLVFTVVLAAVAVPASVAGLVAVLRGAHDHDHDHRDLPVRRSRSLPRRSVWWLAAAVVVVAMSGAMLVLPPATLSARTAQQRTVETGSLSAAAGSNGAAGSPAGTLLDSGTLHTPGFGVKDWASAIRQTTDTASLVGQHLTLTGFVVPAAGGGFTVTRFVISCCAVDAQPVGVGVLIADGSALPAEGSWVRVRGALVANPDAAAGNRLVVRASDVTTVHRPSDPYEY